MSATGSPPFLSSKYQFYQCALAYFVLVQCLYGNEAGTIVFDATINIWPNSSLSPLFSYIHTWKSIKNEICQRLDLGIRGVPTSYSTSLIFLDAPTCWKRSLPTIFHTKSLQKWGNMLLYYHLVAFLFVSQHGKARANFIFLPRISHTKVWEIFHPSCRA
jgi:hypothetical protein